MMFALNLFLSSLLLLLLLLMTLAIDAATEKATSSFRKVDDDEKAEPVPRLGRLRLPKHRRQTLLVEEEPMSDQRRDMDEETDFFLTRLLAESSSLMSMSMSMSMSLSSTPPILTTSPTQSPPSSPPTVACDPACPCCNEQDWPEFVSTIEAYTSNGPCTTSECCFYRENDQSQLFLATECSGTSLEEGASYNVAYMSYDYTGTLSGCTPGETCAKCGDTGFDLPPIVLTDEQAAACERVVQSIITNTNNCAGDNDIPPQSNICRGVS
jgi:hypothetical protein